ncbi:haloacid dehalogenase-like hydrolase family member protein [Babesia caballi]|nr:haloacid dehalogenase-like hydrolase family member protein [Babesia caballi]
MDWPLKVASVDEIVDADILEMLVADYTRLQVHLTSEEGVDFVAKQGACGLCDLSPPGITKVIGLRSLMQHAGATTKDCCYIGDGTNDMEAMEAVDLSFAVGNAIDSVKASAKYVVEETYEEAAFAKVVSLVYDIDVE